MAKRIGEWIDAGEPLAHLHVSSHSNTQTAAEFVRGAVVLSQEPVVCAAVDLRKHRTMIEEENMDFMELAPSAGKLPGFFGKTRGKGKAGSRDAGSAAGTVRVQ